MSHANSNHPHMPISRRAVLGGLGAAALGSIVTSRHAFAAERTSLVYGLSAYPPNLRPWENVGAAAGAVKLMLYRGLLGYDGNGNLAGELAESWKLDGERAYVFALRANAKFHNGDPVTAADIKHSLDQMMAPTSTAFLRQDLQVIETIETPDARTVRLVLKEPSTILPYLLASFNAPMVSAKSKPDAPIGAGPFTLKGMEKGSYIEVERFDGFYKPGKPALKAIRFSVFADEDLRLAALEAGDLDIIEYVPWQSIDRVGRNPKLALETTNGPFMFVMFNTSKGPFADARVRRAVGYAINRKDIINAAFAGKGEELFGLPVPVGSPFAGEDPANSWSYDPAKAKQLLAEAGLAGGFSTSLLSTAQYGMHKNTAEVVQQQLEAVGIMAELKLPDFATRIQLGTKGQYEIAVHGSSGDYNDPDALSPFIGSGSPNHLRSFGFKSERIDAILARGRRELDQAKRVAIYAELRKAFFEEAPLVGLNWRTQAYARKAEIKGFRNLPGFLNVSSPYTLDDVVIG
ncbi:peptide/nickel transport system substrate-binding protein [Bosea sp. OK403]|uniref:ABC transporter substrate-binding protein n=1 Tax=Bosea sp. OK403 TaxID=1855286 RepID=UPI0008E6FA93|nr:ABC transporter substrate-binding protein [Bosea sp. OK403]SFI48695.1 peptide/nickel transport system substrate-binding protein [Bosea sp. OK403]